MLFEPGVQAHQPKSACEMDLVNIRLTCFPNLVVEIAKRSGAGLYLNELAPLLTNFGRRKKKRRWQLMKYLT